MLKQYLETGEIAATHGVKGELRIFPWADSPEFLTGFGTLYFDGGATARKVENARVHKSMTIVKFEGIDDITAAMELLHKIVFIDRRDVALPEGSYFEQDIIGLAVLNLDTGRKYGEVSYVQKTGGNDVYAVRSPDGRETLIPAIPEVVKRIDPENGEILITPLKGLFEDEN